jgi:hypothetical protein
VTDPWPGIVVCAIIPPLGRLRQEHHGLEASLGSIMSSRLPALHSEFQVGLGYITRCGGGEREREREKKKKKKEEEEEEEEERKKRRRRERKERRKEGRRSY